MKIPGILILDIFNIGNFCKPERPERVASAPLRAAFKDPRRSAPERFRAEPTYMSDSGRRPGPGRVANRSVKDEK